MLDRLSHPDRLRLMRFVCSFAWADLEITDAERAFVADLVSRMQLDALDARRVREWLIVPPPPEDVDPTEIPLQHRRLFLDTVLGLVLLDGRLSSAEAENYNLMTRLVG